MFDPNRKKVIVIGLGKSGQAACRLLHALGAQVRAVDSGTGEALEAVAAELKALGIDVRLGVKSPGMGSFHLAVTSPGVPNDSPLITKLGRKTPRISEFELGTQHTLCPSVTITGTNGKTTTTELMERVLNHCQRKAKAAGNIGLPVCDVVADSKELDYLVLEASSYQLELLDTFRPTVGVLLNITPDHLDRYDSLEGYARAKAKLFEKQQAFDFAVVQSEALAYLRSLGLDVPSKLVTFSSANRRADIYYDRGLLVSRIPDWEGPLLNMDDCQLTGPHNAENIMAVLAVSRALRLPLGEVKEAIQSYQPAAHRCEKVATLNGVTFINDSKATNLDAMQKAVQAMPAKSSDPNVWLIAGGKDKGIEYHDAGPLLARRVKGVFLIGETAEKLRAAWSLFAPCQMVGDLATAVKQAAAGAVEGDVVLLSPACSSFDQFEGYEHRGRVFREAVQQLNVPDAGKADPAPVEPEAAAN